MQQEAQLATTSKNISHPVLTLRGKPVNPWLVLISLVFGFFMSLLDVTIVNIAIPGIQSNLNTDLTTVTWVLNAYSLVFAVLLVTMGRFADQFGRKRIFMIGSIRFDFGSRLKPFWRVARTGNSYRRRETMTSENTGANQIKNRSHYRLPAMVAVAGVILLVLGFSLPGRGWLAWIGLALFIAAAFTTRITFFSDWIPSLFRPDKTDDLPPPPTVER